jgi:cytochrome c
MRRSTAALSAIAVLPLLAAPAFADGDPAKGEKVYARCKACHEIAKEQNKVGPYLVGVIGRQAGSVEGFKYSDAMKNSGKTWDEATIAAYVKDPKGYIPGNKMAFAGLKKEDEVENLVAYIKQASASQ